MTEQWFCRIMGEQWGPMSALELYAVARRGRLTRDDVVRKGFNGDWVRAETVDGLFDGTAASTLPKTANPVLDRRRPRPGSRSITSARTRYWLRHGAEMAGPFSSRQILRLAATGRLRPEYLLSNDRNQWLRVADIKSLAIAS
jgi:hypothetical protein